MQSSRVDSEKGFAVVVYLMIGAATATFVLTPHDGMPMWRFVGTLLGLALLAALYALPDNAGRERERNLHPRHLLFQVIAAILVLAINLLGLHGGFTFLPFLHFLVVGHAFTNLPVRYAIVYAVALLATFMVLLYWNGSSLEDVLESGVNIAAGMVFTALFSVLTTLFREESGRTARLLEELRHANRALQAAQEQQKAYAVAEERLFLAREIHDGLGHHLTALNVQLQAAAKLMERDPERALQTIHICRDVAQAALREVRYSVASLRRTPLDEKSLDEAIEMLVKEFARVSPLAVSFRLAGAPEELQPAAALTLYRAAQEGLTNAQKYSQGERAEVELRFGESTVSMQVRNDGPPVTGAEEGFGLVGLRERAARLGGGTPRRALARRGLSSGISVAY